MDHIPRRLGLVATQSSTNSTPPRVLLAKLGLDGHDRGVKVIARALRDAGMEVVYLGMRVTVDQVAAAAAQEDVDVVGISILSGAHMRLIPRLADALQRHGLDGDGIDGGVMLLVGGTIPDGDVEPLHAVGVAGVFPVGSFTNQMVEFIQNNLPRQSLSPNTNAREDDSGPDPLSLEGRGLG